jgi:hypothetical protein
MPLDIGLGILIPITLSKIFGFELTNSFIYFGILFSLLPDIDFLLFKMLKLSGGDHKHREILHFPILYIILGSILVYIFNQNLILLFIICSLFHFLHDSIGIGWGIQWFAPFNMNHYQFLYTANKGMDRSLVYTYKPEELDKISEKYGDKDWFRNIYLKFHPYSLFELFVFIISLIVLYLTRKG